MPVKKKERSFMKLKKKKIPEFKTIEEEANFWDTHDITDEYEGDKPIEVEFDKKLEHVLGIRLDDETINQLDKKGKKLGIGPSTLARMWILEKLQQTN
jgi:hypothetical protein